MAEQQATRLVCLQCQVDNKTVGAEGFCKTCNIHLCGPCVSYHKRPLPMRFHELLSKDEMPKIQTQLQSGDSKDMCTIVCKDHQDTLKFYCKSHDIVICSECLNQNHKNCPETTLISDLKNKDAEFQTMKDKLEGMKKELHGINQKSDRQLLEVGKQSSTAKEDVEKFRKQIGNLNEKLARETSEIVDAIEKEDGSIMKQIKGNCQNETKRITELEQKLKALHEAKRNCDLFVTIKMSAPDVKTTKDQYLRDKDRNTIRKYNFVAESRLNEVVRGVKSYGNLVDGSGKDVRPGVVLNRMGPLDTSQRVIQVKYGKIEDEEADVIVNSVDKDLNLKKLERTISSSIELKAGKEAESSLKVVASGQEPKYGDVFDADPAKLKCKRLYHVIVKDYSPTKSAESVELMAKIITECLRKACASGYKNISFPAIGTGVRKHPTDFVAKVFLQSILDFVVANKKASLEVINIVILDGDKTEQGEDKLVVFERELAREGVKSGVKKVFALPN